MTIKIFWGWFDNHTRNAFVLNAARQARMDDLRGQMTGYMQTNVEGEIRWGTEHGLIGSGMGTGYIGAFNKLDKMFIATPYGKAFQSTVRSAVGARKKVLLECDYVELELWGEVKLRKHNSGH